MAKIAILRKVGGLVFDATFSEDHSSDLTVTDNPVELGRKVSDHAYMEPLSVRISAGVSDTPLHILAADPFGGGTSGRAKRAFDLLQRLQAEAEPFEIQTGLRLYENMVCKSVKASQNKDTSGALIFIAEMREVLIVNTQSITYTASASSAPAKAVPAVNKGEQQGAQVTAAPKKASILKRLSNAVGN